MKITIFQSGFQLVLFGYPILSQTSGYQHIICLKKRKGYIFRKFNRLVVKMVMYSNFSPSFASYE